MKKILLASSGILIVCFLGTFHFANELSRPINSELSGESSQNERRQLSMTNGKGCEIDFFIGDDIVDVSKGAGLILDDYWFHLATTHSEEKNTVFLFYVMNANLDYRTILRQLEAEDFQIVRSSSEKESFKILAKNGSESTFSYSSALISGNTQIMITANTLTPNSVEYLVEETDVLMSAAKFADCVL